MDSLPFELIKIILEYIESISDLIRLKRISKKFYKIISSIDLLKNRSPIIKKSVKRFNIKLNSFYNDTFFYCAYCNYYNFNSIPFGHLCVNCKKEMCFRSVNSLTYNYAINCKNCIKIE
jgi:hypothetical protein